MKQENNAETAIRMFLKSRTKDGKPFSDEFIEKILSEIRDQSCKVCNAEARHMGMWLPENSSIKAPAGKTKMILYNVCNNHINSAEEIEKIIINEFEALN